MSKRALFLLCLLLVAPNSWPGAVAAPEAPLRATRLGVTFISSAQEAMDEARYQAGLSTGADWTRWPLYWSAVEQEPGVWDWSAYDRLVAGDIAHGLRINAILLGAPKERIDRERGRDVPANLWEPIFADGTDAPGPGKQINAANLWAVFVYAATQRYRPGGALSARLGWGPGEGVRVWEVWNEPDYRPFWSSGVENYVRLLKVAALAIRHADPEARVMFGGLANHQGENWLAECLKLIARDPDHELHRWYFDIVAVHHYSFAMGTWQVVDEARQTLRAYGIERPIWVNESGVPVWDDYPGPTWADDDAQRALRATMQEQAAFVIQSIAYAFAAGADIYFYHQLYDDCGNQPRGVDFPPHDGTLCKAGFQCWGDAYGLFRNPADAACFRQHPYPGTPRPALRAFQTAAKVFGAQPFEVASMEHRGKDRLETWITFRRPRTRERILVVWNRSGDPVAVAVPATSGQAMLYDMAGREQVITPSGGVYSLRLPAATNQTYAFLPPTERYAIGGAPYILVEQDLSGLPLLPSEQTNR